MYKPGDKVKILINSCGHKRGDIGEIKKVIDEGYLVFVPNRQSSSCYYPYVCYRPHVLSKEYVYINKIATKYNI